MSAAHPLVVVVGATGTGKSDLSLDLAEAITARGGSAEIVNGDAMQFYRGMDIGTAKLPGRERRGVPHHLLGGLVVGIPPRGDDVHDDRRDDDQCTEHRGDHHGAMTLHIGLTRPL